MEAEDRALEVRQTAHKNRVETVLATVRDIKAHAVRQIVMLQDNIEVVGGAGWESASPHGWVTNQVESNFDI